MPAIKPPRRVQVNADILEPSLRTLGYSPDHPLSLQIQESVKILADLVHRASVEVEKILDPEEWNLIADVLNGCLDLYLYSESSLPASLLLTAQVEDAHRLDRVGDKWFEADSDRRMTALRFKIQDMSELQCHVVLAAVRYFWTVQEHPDDWWLVKHRIPARKGK